MTRIFNDFAYGNGPVARCFWAETSALEPCAPLDGLVSCDVAVIGAGVTGLNAALRLANGGRDVCVLDARQPGWGASGRNGGFSCLGGGRLSGQAMERNFGPDGRAAFRRAEMDAVAHVAEVLDRYAIDADTHSDGETLLAHSPRAFEHMRREIAVIRRDYGVEPRLTERKDLADQGLGGRFFGAMTLPVGFALNPRKYVHGLARAAHSAGVRIFGDSPVEQLFGQDGGIVLQTANGTVRARNVILAMNGYASETLPAWMAGRYLPVQSNILVTRVLSEEERAAQGWQSRQMSYDSRALLHYFRLLPDNRFLFGLRGGLTTGKATEARMLRHARADFQRLFPAWSHVHTPWFWSGFVCFSQKLLPYAGPVPEIPGLYAAFAYHGNGVSMGSYLGAALGDMLLGNREGLPIPDPIRRLPGKFPLGRARRALLWPAYLGARIMDALP